MHDHPKEMEVLVLVGSVIAWGESGYAYPCLPPLDGIASISERSTAASPALQQKTMSSRSSRPLGDQNMARSPHQPADNAQRNRKPLSRPVSQCTRYLPRYCCEIMQDAATLYLLRIRFASFALYLALHLLRICALLVLPSLAGEFRHQNGENVREPCNAAVKY